MIKKIFVVPQILSQKRPLTLKVKNTEKYEKQKKIIK